MKTITLEQFNSFTEEDFKRMLLEYGCFIAPMKNRWWMVNPPTTDFTLETRTFKYAWSYFYGALIKNK